MGDEKLESSTLIHFQLVVVIGLSQKMCQTAALMFASSSCLYFGVEIPLA